MQLYDVDATMPTGGLIHSLRNGTVLDGGGPLVSSPAFNTVTGNLSAEEALVAPYLAIPDGGVAAPDASVQLVTGGNPPPSSSGPPPPRACSGPPFAPPAGCPPPTS